ncbi:hypothetical protein HDV06_006899 [Boothiomyces sp. JEL0866]|nr:hypothetical protein HDV06_006899 [Boothiomyces sp. JEL0866]
MTLESSIVDRKPFVNERVLVDGFVCTVKYVGEIQGKKGTWFGVEWDDSTRGKHSGTFNGVQYFETSYENAGSFLAESKTFHHGVSFSKALREKYLKTEGKKEMKWGNKVVETVGWNKLNAKISNLAELRELGLAGLNIQEKGDTLDLPNVEDLDLSRNLFQSFQVIQDIVKDLPKIQILRLNRNRIQFDLTSDGLKNVRILTLIGTNCKWSDILSFERHLPILEELHLGSNGISELIVPQGGQLKNLKALNLEDNSLKDWNEILKLQDLTVTSLSLQNNQVEQILATQGFKDLRVLNLKKNNICTWKDVNMLNEYNVVELRIGFNPVTEYVSFTSRLMILTGRLSKVKVLEGSLITPLDRRDAECYYLNQAHEDIDKPNFKELHPRYDELCSIHGTPVTVKIEKTVGDGLIKVVFKGEKQVEKKVHKKLAGRMLKSVVARSCYAQWQKVMKKELVLIQGNVETVVDELRDLDFYQVEDGDIFYLK